MCRLGLAAAFAWLAAGPLSPSRAEVILTGEGGKRVIGEAIVSENEETVELLIYRGFTQRLPRKGIQERTERDRTFRAERATFGERQAAWDGTNAAAGLALAQWARESGLGLQARTVLQRLTETHPGHPEVRAAAGLTNAPAALTDDTRRFLETEIARFFSSSDARKTALDNLRGRDALPYAEVNDWAARCFTEARKGVRLGLGDVNLPHPAFTGRVHVAMWTRPGAPPAAEGERIPAVIALHGGGLNRGRWQDGPPGFFRHFQAHFDRLLCVAPVVLHKRYAEWGGQPIEEFYVGEVFNAMKRTWPIDTDRVYLAGHSMGGYGTWHIGGHRADQFAGLVSSAGGLLIGSASGTTWGWGTIGNLMHTPIAFLHGGRDTSSPPWSDAEAARVLADLAREFPDRYRHRYDFFPEGGHTLPAGKEAEAVKWIVQHRRPLYPSEILWEPNRPFNRLFYWLWADNPRPFTRIHARIEKNTIHLKTDTLWGGFSILLNEKLVDWRRPVTVLANGERVYRGTAVPTLSTILLTVADRIDENQWYAARLEF